MPLRRTVVVFLLSRMALGCRVVGLVRRGPSRREGAYPRQVMPDRHKSNHAARESEQTKEPIPQK